MSGRPNSYPFLPRAGWAGDLRPAWGRVRNGVRYVDRQGRRIGRETWRALSGRPEYVLVGWDRLTVEGRNALVTTVWRGIVVGTNPAVFLTLVDGWVDGWEDQRWSWSSLAEAVRGHRQVVDQLRLAVRGS
jgi:hypothetical protein